MILFLLDMLYVITPHYYTKLLINCYYTPILHKTAYKLLFDDFHSKLFRKLSVFTTLFSLARSPFMVIDIFESPTTVDLCTYDAFTRFTSSLKYYADNPFLHPPVPVSKKVSCKFCFYSSILLLHSHIADNE